MTKTFHIVEDEMWPWYSIDEVRPSRSRQWGRGPFEVDDETWARWERVISEMEAVQQELERIYNPNL